MWNLSWWCKRQKEEQKMTLQQVIQAFEMVASQQPSVNMIVRNDIFRLNSKSDARYGVFGWTQGQHSSSADSSMFTYSFTFFYVDRLKNDVSNQIEVQSVGIQTLDNILRKLDDMGIYVISTYNFQTFNQRFLDECAGVFCNVTLQVPVNAICAESFADYDLNNMIY
jgi:hypothetical protein